MTFTIGNVKSNIDSHSLNNTTTSLTTHRRLAIEAKLYYLRDTNTPEEFDYVVEAELRRSEAREFGLPAKELLRRTKLRVRKVFKSFSKREFSRRDVTATIHERLQAGKSCNKPTRVLKKANKKAAVKQTWENSAQGVAAALLAY